VSTSQAPAAAEPVVSKPDTANLDDWLENKVRDIRGETKPEIQPEVAATPAPEPAQPPVNWKDVKFGDDVDNEYFKGKPVAEALKSYKELRTHHDTYKSKTEQELRTLREQLDEVRTRQVADAAIRDYVQRGEQQANTPDPRYVRAQQLWHDDPAEALRLITEINDERAQQIVQANLGQYREQSSAEQHEARVRQAGTMAYDAAVSKMQAAYGMDEKTAKIRANYLIPIITDGNPQALFSADAYMEAAEQIFGKPNSSPTPPVVIAAPPVAQTPPGSARPAPPVQQIQTTPISEERLEALRALSDDPKVIAKMIEKQTKRK
jgi:hypothetical protein